MSDEKDPRPQFFRDVHDLAQKHGIIAYIVVGVVQRDGTMAIASGAGSRLDDEADVTPKIYGLVGQSFKQALDSISSPPETAPKGTLVN